jgi:hypothetical protein
MNIDNYFLRLLSDISAYTSVIPLIISLRYYKSINRTLKPLFILSILSVVAEVLNKIHVEYDINNYYIFHIFTIIEFTLISLFYKRFFLQFKNIRIFEVFIFVFFIIAFIDYKINGLDSMDSFSITVESVILTSYSLILFYFVLQKLIFENLLNTPIFWMNTAILIYFSGNLILFVFSNYLLATEPKKYHMLWYTIHSFINISYNALISVGFWKTKIK